MNQDKANDIQRKKVKFEALISFKGAWGVGYSPC